VPKPRLVLHIATQQPLAICCGDDEQEESSQSDPDKIWMDENCIYVAAMPLTEPVELTRVQRVPPRRITVRPGTIILFNQFRNLNELLSELPRLREQLPALEGRDGVLSLAVPSIRHLQLKQLSPLKKFSKSTGYNVHLTVYD